MLRSYAPAAHEVLTPAPSARSYSLPPRTLYLKMHSNADQARLLHQTTIALTQLHRPLQQATDILANLHSLYLVHTRQVDPQFQLSFLYGRYVCREAQVTLDEFEESDERIRARTKEANPPPKQTSTQTAPQRKPKRSWLISA